MTWNNAIWNKNTVVVGTEIFKSPEIMAFTSYSRFMNTELKVIFNMPFNTVEIIPESEYKCNDDVQKLCTENFIWFSQYSVSHTTYD